MHGFDYIVVGAGSAGCVLARRLSDQPDKRVLLIEAGGDNQDLFIKMAGGFTKIMGKPEYFWSFPVAAQDGRRPERHAYGKGLGGSSAINGTWYLRGQPRDFESWRDFGLTNWSWSEIARCYKAIESYQAPGADPSRGSDGPLQITPSTHRSPVFDAFIAACEEMSVPWLSDICTPGVEGAGRSQYTVDRRGQRASAYEAFLAPVRRRPNLMIVDNCLAKRIVIEGRRATAVVCERDGEEVRYDAAGEIIVSAGVYKSPQLLQLSGIGPGELLQSFGIDVAHELPAVGRNLCDHQKLGVSYDLHGHPGINREYVGWRLYANAMRYFSTGDGPLARVGMPMTALVSSEGDPTWPDLQLAAAPFAMRTVNEMVAKPGSPITARPGITFSGYHLRPKSRGAVVIRSPDIRENPHVELDLWQDPTDVQRSLTLVKYLRRMASTRAMSSYVGDERSPGSAFDTDEKLVPELRYLLDAGLHGTGTCSMGADSRHAVVDDRCRVHGIDGLRVVDCSILPTPVSGNTNGPAMAVAQRASELILN